MAWSRFKQDASDVLWFVGTFFLLGVLWFLEYKVLWILLVLSIGYVLFAKGSKLP